MPHGQAKRRPANEPGKSFVGEISGPNLVPPAVKTRTEFLLWEITVNAWKLESIVNYDLKYEYTIIPIPDVDGIPPGPLKELRATVKRLLPTIAKGEGATTEFTIGDLSNVLIKAKFWSMLNADKQALNRFRDALDQVTARSRGNGHLAREAIPLLEGALTALRGEAALGVNLSEGRSQQGKEGGEDFAHLALPPATMSPEPAMSAQETVERLKKLREMSDIQAFLDRFVVGKSWGNVDDDQVVADGVTAHLQEQKPKLRVECTSDGEPSLLRCYQRTGSDKSKFIFEHFTEGAQRKHGGSATVPKLRVVLEGPDLRRKSRRVTKSEA